MSMSRKPSRFVLGFVLFFFGYQAISATLNGSFTAIPTGSSIDLSAAGPLDWIHWGLYTETSLDRKAGVTPLISNLKLLDDINGFSYLYQYSDNPSGYNWCDGSSFFL